MNVQKFLNDHRTQYRPIPHRPIFEAQRLAQAIDVSGDKVAKSVVLRSDHNYMLAVVPATCRIDLAEARRMLNARDLELASEDEVGQKFADCERGSVPPFGSQYGMPTLVDESLATRDEIIIEGNTHEESIALRFDDYEQLEHPRHVRISRHA